MKLLYSFEPILYRLGGSEVRYLLLPNQTHTGAHFSSFPMISFVWIQDIYGTLNILHLCVSIYDNAISLAFLVNGIVAMYIAFFTLLT